MTPNVEPVGHPRPRVLIVDDEASVRATLAALLEGDFDVTEAASADAALLSLRAERCDVVVTDYQMPGGNGVELLDRITVEHPDVLGILLTGHGELPEVRAAKADRRIFYVLLKGGDPASLVHWTKAAANSARLRRTMSSLKRRLDR